VWNGDQDDDDNDAGDVEIGGDDSAYEEAGDDVNAIDDNVNMSERTMRMMVLILLMVFSTMKNLKKR